MKILVVDDEIVSREKMAKILSSFGEVKAVDDGSKAITAFSIAMQKNDPFGLITLDISMPGFDGNQVLGQIRELEKARGIEGERRCKVIMVTAKADKGTVIVSLRTGCDDYVVKPFDRAAILEKMENLGLIKK